MADGVHWSRPSSLLGFISQSSNWTRCVLERSQVCLASLQDGVREGQPFPFLHTLLPTSHPEETTCSGPSPQPLRGSHPGWGGGRKAASILGLTLALDEVEAYQIRNGNGSECLQCVVPSTVGLSA